MARKKKVRLQDIAEKTGYSISTISHFINKTRNIDESTQESIFKVLQELEYQPPSKRSHKAKSLSIGVVISDVRVDFFDELIRELEDIAYEEGYQITFMDSEENPEKELYCIKTLIKNNVAGIILAPSNAKADLGFCANFPIVQVDRMLDDSTFDFVGIDNMMVTYSLTKKIISKGVKNIGLISFTEDNYCARERTKGYRLAMIENHIFNTDHMLVIDYDASTNNSNISNFIGSHPEIDTVICASSNICYEVLGKIKRLGEKNHIKHVCTFDNNKWLDYVQFPVDAISQPITNIAMTAVEMLKNKITRDQNSNISRKIILNCTIEGRSSLFKVGDNLPPQLLN